MGTDVEQGHIRNWQSVRTILEGLILVGVLYLANSTNESSKATIKLNEQIVSMTNEVKQLRQQIDNVQALALDLAKTDVRLDEHERRIGTLEQARVHDAVRGVK